MQLDGGTPNWPSPDGSLDYLDGYRPDTPQGERDAGSPDSTDATRDGSVPRRDAPDSVSDAAPAPDMAPVVDADPSCDPAPAPPKCEAGLVRDARTDPLTDCVIGWRCICPPPEQDEAPTCSVGRPERITNQAGCPMRFECRCPSAPAQPTCYFELEAEKDDDGCVVDWSCIEPAVCQHKEASGLPRNPGCDPDVITKGFSAIGRITEGEIYFTQGKKLWALYTASGGTFSAAVPDLATFLRQLATEDGVTNPGTDASIQAGGLDSLGAVAAGDERLVYITRKTRWWSYNLDRGAFVGNGDSLANALGAFSPPVGTPCPVLNPGCNLQVQKNGLTAIEFVPGEGGALWLLLQGAQYWIYDEPNGKFSQQGNIADYFLRFIPAGQETCASSRFADGTFKNPGCTSQIRASGPTAIGEIELLGKSGWLITRGTSYWHLDSSLTFVEGGKDLAAFLRRISTRPTS